MQSSYSLPKIVSTELPVFARFAAVGITTFPALRKFMQYPERVAQFEVWEVPWPEIAVLVAGTVQLLAVVTIALGLGGRFGANVLAFVMVVAMSTAGPNLLNGTVFVSSVVILLLGTGRYSVWDPAMTEIIRVAQRIPSRGA
ncbi:DoxX family protein [Natrinema sp. 1APR25-10V2]|uniref:DoxX family protein n=1 Tax=Natrinema sp. 1APR25-10V2 TaxID=2951081 RepID=UPI0028757137|nr:DoxX family protein [Natrinema sp. 1APR25-10V2]MDS0474573.1 DoxX family protein [Natrinema sp. 1APR25-10V2]